MSDEIIGPPPPPQSFVVAIQALQIQVQCLLAAVAILSSDVRPELIRAAAAAVRSTSLPSRERGSDGHV
jgi:hypothetical protein